MAKAATLEDNFSAMEEILGKLEEGNLSLDESFRLYKEGMKLVLQCNQQIDKVEKQIILLDSEKEEQDGI